MTHTSLRATLPPAALLEEQAYLVARGVRALALVGHHPATDPTELLKLATRIERVQVEGALPFVLDRGDGVADYGFAAAPWVLDLLEWSTKSAPAPQQHRILGLLLGYSAEAIQRHEAAGKGRRF